MLCLQAGKYWEGGDMRGVFSFGQAEIVTALSSDCLLPIHRAISAKIGDAVVDDTSQVVGGWRE